MEQQAVLNVLNDPKVSSVEKYQFAKQTSDTYYDPELFTEFCAENWSDLDEKMIEFYDRHWHEVINYALEISYFPQQKKTHYQSEYQQLMERYFRRDAKEYLNFNIY